MSYVYIFYKSKFMYEYSFENESIFSLKVKVASRADFCFPFVTL